MRRTITPIISVFILFLVSGLVLTVDTGTALARGFHYDASTTLPGGADNSLCPEDDSEEPGDRGSGDDDAPGETVKLEGTQCAPVNSGKTAFWFKLKVWMTWIFF